MNNKNTDFPQYRMLLGRKVYYKITNDREFIELTWIGSKKMSSTIKATQYPEMLRIMDMLACNEPFGLLPKEEENEFNETN
jgi:hypothetical protein